MPFRLVSESKTLDDFERTNRTQQHKLCIFPKHLSKADTQVTIPRRVEG